MDTQRQFNIDNLLEPLEEQVRSGNFEIQQFQNIYKMLKIGFQKFQSTLDIAYDENRNSKDWYSLYSSVKSENLSDMMDRLRGLGYHYSKEKSFREIFEKQGYRLLEQTRAGKRDVVYYGLLRIFISFPKEFPKILMEPFKSVYTDNMFKVLMFSFLSGVLGKEDVEV